VAPVKRSPARGFRRQLGDSPLVPLPNAARNAAVASTFLTSLGIALLAALAVQLGFGAAFVDDALGLPIAIYTCALCAAFARSVPGVQRVQRIGVACAVGALTAWALRTVLMFELPFGQFVTTGHSPFTSLPLSALAGELVNACIAWFSARRGKAEAAASPGTREA
jgi:hypothetical protein